MKEKHTWDIRASSNFANSEAGHFVPHDGRKEELFLELSWTKPKKNRDKKKLKNNNWF